MVYMRSSGAPLDRASWIALLKSDDIENYTSKMVSIDSVKIIGGGRAAVVVFTEDQSYSYKGE